MNDYQVEVYRQLRDHGKPVTQQDAADFIKIREPQPPSRAHLARLKRHALGRRFVDAPFTVPKSAEARQAEIQRAFHKRIIADLGGSRTIVPTDAPRSRPLQYIIPARSAEMSYDEKLTRKGQHLAREHIVANGRLMFQDYQPDMFDVLDAFGSFPAYCKEI